MIDTAVMLVHEPGRNFPTLFVESVPSDGKCFCIKHLYINYVLRSVIK